MNSKKSTDIVIDRKYINSLQKGIRLNNDKDRPASILMKCYECRLEIRLMINLREGYFFTKEVICPRCFITLITFNNI